MFNWHEICAAGAMMVSLTFYALMGGADYGGGVWDFLAFGPRKDKQRKLVAEAIGPIWEANHVWLILVIVILFTAFPPAFAAISTSLHIPLMLMLIGIVLRGSAFTFRTYDSEKDKVQQRWGRIFAVASLVTPILLGVIVGAISSGAIGAPKGTFLDDFIFVWLKPFPVAVGVFALSLFAYLAAIYLTLETDDPQLQDDFRARALVTAFFVAVMAYLVFHLSASGAPDIRADLAGSAWAWPLHATTALAAAGAFSMLWLRRFRLARTFAVGQVTLILWGWGLAQFPYLVRPELTISNSASPPQTLTFLLLALAAGMIFLIPSFYYLMRIFKTRPETF